MGVALHTTDISATLFPVSSTPPLLPLYLPNSSPTILETTEVEIWEHVDAPRTLAGEDLTVSDFVVIFQQLVETMLTACDAK